MQGMEMRRKLWQIFLLRFPQHTALCYKKSLGGYRELRGSLRMLHPLRRAVPPKKLGICHRITKIFKMP